MDKNGEKCSSSSDSEEENENPIIPPMDLSGPKKVNVGNSKDVKIGNTVNMTINVKNMVLNKEDSNLMVQGGPSAISGMMVTTLARNTFTQNTVMLEAQKIELSSLGDHYSLNPTTRAANLFELCSLPKPEELHFQKQELTNPVKSKRSFKSDRTCKNKRLHRETERKSLEKYVDDAHILDFDKLRILPQQIKEENVSVDSLLNDFVENINNYIIGNGNDQHIDVPSMSNKLNKGIFERLNMSIRGENGKLKGFLPLIREKDIHIDFGEKLLFVSVPLTLNNLQISFDKFSVEWKKKDFIFCGLIEIKIAHNVVLINLSTATDDRGYSQNDVSVEINLKKIEIDFQGSFGNELVSDLAGRVVRELFFEQYYIDVNFILKEFYEKNIKRVLNYDDVCTKIASIYM